MRKTLMTLTALAGLVGAGAVMPSAASAQPWSGPGPAFGPGPGFVQPTEYYGGGYDPRAAEWREREWRRREWERHHRWEEHRWHEEHRGW